MPLPPHSLVHLIVSLLDLAATSACVLLRAIAVLKSLVTVQDMDVTDTPQDKARFKTGDTSLKPMRDAVMSEFFMRENKHKLLFFELNSSRLDSLAGLTRAALIAKYSDSFSLDVPCLPCPPLVHLLATDVQLLYHAALVEVFSLCLEGCGDPLLYLRCLSFETVVAVLQTREAYTCPPLVHAYSLYLHQIFLRGDGSPGYLRRIPTGDKSAVDLSSDERLLDCLSKLCAAAMAPESLASPLRPVIFNTALPCLLTFLAHTSLVHVLPHGGGTSSRDPLVQSLLEQTSQLLAHLLNNSSSLTSRELLHVTQGWEQLSIPMPSSASFPLLPVSRPGAVGSADHESAERGVEMLPGGAGELSKHVETQQHVLSLLEHCPILEQVEHTCHLTLSSCHHHVYQS